MCKTATKVTEIKIQDTVVSSIHWTDHVGEVPGDWIEKWAVIGFWSLRVWFSCGGFFGASMTNNETGERRRLSIGKPEDLETACSKAAKVAIKSMTK